jgi:hypothetical protein
MKNFLVIHHTWMIQTPDSISTAREKLRKQIEKQKERAFHMRKKPFSYLLDHQISLSGDVCENDFTVFKLVDGHTKCTIKAHGKLDGTAEGTIIHMSADANLASFLITMLFISAKPYYSLYLDGVKTLKNNCTIGENVAAGIMIAFIGLTMIVIVGALRQQCQSEIKFYKKELNKILF